MDTQQLLSAYKTAENLKRTERHSYLSDGTTEDVGSHTWSSCYLAVLLYPYLESRVNLSKSIELLVVHDLPEAETGDCPAHLNPPKMVKFHREAKALESILTGTGRSAAYIRDRWLEFERNQTIEAKYAQAVDKLDGGIQHYLMPSSLYRDHELTSDVHYKPVELCSFDKSLFKLALDIADLNETKCRRISNERLTNVD